MKGQVYWQVNFPIRFENGKRIQERRTYKSHDEAKTGTELARIKVKNEGRISFAILDHVRRDALAAVKELEDFNVTILEAAS